MGRGFDPTAVNRADKLIDLAKFPGFPTVKGVLLFAGQNGIGHNAGNTDWTAIQPRFGMAYQIRDKVVMRGGIGKYYLNPNNDDLQSPGFSQSTPLINSLDSGRRFLPSLLSNPFPNGVTVPPGSSLGGLSFVGRGPQFFDPTFKLPYVYQFSFGFQYQLPIGSTIDLSYVGNPTYNLESDPGYNEPRPASPHPC